jgi:hypothetical protein
MSETFALALPSPTAVGSFEQYVQAVRAIPMIWHCASSATKIWMQHGNW